MSSFITNKVRFVVSRAQHPRLLYIFIDNLSARFYSLPTRAITQQEEDLVKFTRILLASFICALAASHAHAQVRYVAECRSGKFVENGVEKAAPGRCSPTSDSVLLGLLAEAISPGNKITGADPPCVGNALQS